MDIALPAVRRLPSNDLIFSSSPLGWSFFIPGRTLTTEHAIQSSSGFLVAVSESP
ncbi:MAG: hypothetical protein IPN02_04860 [Candidatus Microthrix sp.]|uniref:Uncharacterized protein n=1 Tax=Candidatus Neomicrothrix subdominans TaxID=2954438 RepID=A0A936N9N1_9ACTN|nr:hypothetical protein [Candidatus Microthrix subdominans]